MLANKRLGFMADIKEHTVNAQALHFMVDGAGDDIARGQLAALVKVRHKAGAVRAFKVGAFAAQRFSKQEITRLGVI